MDLGLKDRVAIVTGSSQGIGKGIALGLSQEKAKVAICARNEQRLLSTAAEIESLSGSEVLPIVADLAKREDIRRLVDHTVNHFGRIDILVNNTGGPPSSLFEETQEKLWQESITLLLMSVVRMCQEVIPHMRLRGWGRIINMSSFVAKQPIDRLVLSNSLRAGIFGLSKTLSNELAHDGILVNVVCPGWTLTRRVEELARTQAKETHKNYEDIIQSWQSQIPLRRLAQPGEIANLVVFLASERASYITGAALQVDGGLVKSLL